MTAASPNSIFTPDRRPMLAALGRNDALIAALVAWALAQFLKVLTAYASTRRLDFRLWASAGGMPSSHSAFVSALALAVGWLEGWESPLFAATFVFSTIVMYDASGVRRAASEQARILNHIVAELFAGHPISDRQLKELLGHTPVQVLAGAALGIAIGWLWMSSR